VGFDGMNATSPPALECRALSVGYEGPPVLSGLDLDVAEGETLAVLGPSGAGKTTLLYAVAGFLEPAAGKVRIKGRLVAGDGVALPPEERDVAVVFQNYALWPHLTALQTVAYPLRRRRLAAGAAEARARELLDLMGVAELADRRPAALSGGEQQRVGVARALAREAGLVLLDEPTAHLDAPLRARLLGELTEQRRASGLAAVYATHDVTEALAVADRVALLREGHVVQVGPPQEIYERPADLWIARLSGPAAVLTGQVAGASDGRTVIRFGSEQLALRLDGSPPAAGAEVQVLVRPDWATLGQGLSGVVTAALYRGPHTDYRIATTAGELDLREPGPPRARVGEHASCAVHRGWVLP
jgi:ABC-type Fe3+/spermidine/putrescine transport system ATPase subunit